MKNKHWVALGVAAIAAVSGITGASINAIRGSGDVVNVYIGGEKIELDNEAVQEMITENDDLTEQNNEYKKNMELLSSGYKVLEEDSQDKEAEILRLKEENEDLKSKIEDLETENESLQSRLTDQGNQNGQEGETEQIEGAVEFSEVPDILYDGGRHKKYVNSEQGFSVGGKTYYSGFELNTWISSNRGFAYFNLEGKYSVMEFDVGRNKDDKLDATLLVTSSDGLHEEYNLAGDVPSQHIKIYLEKANDLTIKLICDEGLVGYGFFNVYYIP